MVSWGTQMIANKQAEAIRLMACLAFLTFAMMPVALQAQSSGGSGSSGSTNNAPRPTRSTNRNDQFTSPVFVTGRVMTELNRAPEDPVTVELSCGMKVVSVIHTDIGGYFTFSVGGSTNTFQSNMDFSASNEGPTPLSQTMTRPIGQSANPLSGCELRVAHAGFMPITATVPMNTDMNRVEMGTLRLVRIGGDKAAAVSVTSLMVPKDAAKEYDNAVKDLRDGKLATALPHLEKAVEIYPRYAEAWNELGRVRLTQQNRAKAREAFNMAVSADAEFTLPYINIASMNVQDKQWKEAADAAGKALTIDNRNPMSAVLFAIATYNLNDLDSAEKSALHASALGQEKLPQAHSLLTEIYLVKEEFGRAAQHARAYLQLAPAGPFAARMKEGLAQMEQAGVDMTPPAEAAPGSDKSGG